MYTLKRFSIMYSIGDKVKIISDNECYDEFRDEILIINLIATNEAEHIGYDNSMDGMALMEFETEEGEEIPFALYEYEVEAS